MEFNENRIDALKNAVILIPSLEPDDRLPAYIRKLADLLECADISNMSNREFLLEMLETEVSI